MLLNCLTKRSLKLFTWSLSIYLLLYMFNERYNALLSQRVYIFIISTTLKGVKQPLPSFIYIQAVLTLLLIDDRSNHAMVKKVKTRAFDFPVLSFFANLLNSHSPSTTQTCKRLGAWHDCMIWSHAWGWISRYGAVSTWFRLAAQLVLRVHNGKK